MTFCSHLLEDTGKAQKMQELSNRKNIQIIEFGFVGVTRVLMCHNARIERVKVD
jgi:hypothetical protein